MLHPPPPNAQTLLPPLLACLPISFVSPHPPPALLPLLSPLLRQRLTYLNASRPDGWVRLLSWDCDGAALLSAAIDRLRLEPVEPHPVSGEVELEDVPPATFRRLDRETLQARLEVPRFGLWAVYVWCEAEALGEAAGPGWRLAELGAMEWWEGERVVLGWWEGTMTEADDAAACKSPQSGTTLRPHNDKDDEDDYWASYDRTPGRGPTPTKTPAAQQARQGPADASRAERDYYARYGAEVQPALDSHDRDEDAAAARGPSTLKGDTLLLVPSHQRHDDEGARPSGASMFPADDARPSGASMFPADDGPVAVSAVTALDRHQLAIKQHISTDMKSLFRLARTAGMDRHEFARVVTTNLDCLALFEQDE